MDNAWFNIGYLGFLRGIRKFKTFPGYLKPSKSLKKNPGYH
jgi:hypothetical protein